MMERTIIVIGSIPELVYCPKCKRVYIGLRYCDCMP